MKKRLVTVITAAVLGMALLAGCGGSGAASSSSGEQAQASEESKKITIAASPTPHAEILEAAKPILAEKGYELEIKVFEDYVQPNEVVNSGEIDANYFQHLPYLEDFNNENGTKIESIATIHVEPLGLYGGKQTNLDALK